MWSVRRIVPGIALLALTLLGRVEAADFNMKLSVDGIQLGKHLLGPEVKAENLQNRVVLLDFWGVNCGPCLASMPKLSLWNLELQSQGLVIIGAHAQAEPAERVKSTAMSRGANFTIVERAGVKDGQDFNRIPHCMLFDHTGKCIFRGSPFDVEPILRKAVQDAPPPLLEGKKLTKLVSMNTSLKKEKSFGALLKQAKASMDSKDATTVEEASFVVDKLTAHGRKLIDDAKEKKEMEPLTTWQLTQRAATNFVGTDLGTEASTLLSDLKKDKKFQADLKAWQNLQSVFALQATLLTTQGAEKPTDAGFQKLNAGTLKQMTDLIKQMKKTAPESKATEAAMKIAEQLALKVG
jgi:thiol-disulfide isomerase/thioredoxin